jgi:hypothetical protein
LRSASVSLLSIDMDRPFIARMYHLGPRVALNFDQLMSALPPIADIRRGHFDVC